MKILELKEQRAKLIADARAVIEQAEKENRALSAEEDGQFKRMLADAGALKDRIESLENLQLQEAEVNQVGQRRSDANIPGAKPGERNEQPIEIEIRGRKYKINGGTPDYQRSTPQYNENHARWIRTGMTGIDPETRALMASGAEEGGYTIAPQQFVANLLKFVDDQVQIRQKATVWTMTSAESMGVPTLAADPDDADWTTELATGSEDSAMSFGKREMRPHPLAKRIKISNKLLRVSALPIEQLVNQRLGYKFAVSEEKAFLTAEGNQRPLGAFVASNDGVPTSRDVVTGSQTTVLADCLRTALYSLKPQYRLKSDWMFHRTTVAVISKLKDGNGQYMWQPGIVAGQPDTILGRPVMESEYCPSTLTNGLYCGMLADWSFYWIVEALSMQMQRLGELYAETNQTGFIGRMELDGAPVMAEAFVRLKCGT